MDGLQAGSAAEAAGSAKPTAAANILKKRRFFMRAAWILTRDLQIGWRGVAPAQNLICD
jgi:hypothetical protein